MYVQFAKAKFCLYQFICIYYRYYEIFCLCFFFLPKEMTLNFPIKQALFYDLGFSRKPSKSGTYSHEAHIKQYVQFTMYIWEVSSYTLNLNLISKR